MSGLKAGRFSGSMVGWRDGCTVAGPGPWLQSRATVGDDGGRLRTARCGGFLLVLRLPWWLLSVTGCSWGEMDENARASLIANSLTTNKLAITDAHAEDF